LGGRSTHKCPVNASIAGSAATRRSPIATDPAPMARRPTSADSPGSWTTLTSSTPSVVTTPTSGRSNCRCP